MERKDFMNKTRFDFFSYQSRKDARGQGLVEYAVLLAFVAIVAIAGLELAGGSVKQGFINVCAELGNDECEAAKTTPKPAVVTSTTPTPASSPTATATATVTPALDNPEPTRPPVIVASPTATATKAENTVTMRIKVVINEKKGGKKEETKDGVRVALYNEAGRFVAQGRTDDKGNVSFIVPTGTYTVVTYHEGEWEKHGPFTVKNSNVNVIHISKDD
jgi:Flp pilus assembly pilin Flp